MKRPKINIRVIKFTVLTIILFALIGFTERKQKYTVCNDIIVELYNHHENYFLDKDDVKAMIIRTDQSIIGSRMAGIKLKEIERKIEHNKHVLRADLYNDLKGHLIAKIVMRRPIARIVQPDAPDAYVAEDGVIMDVSEKYTARQLIITGHNIKELLESGDLRSNPFGQKLYNMIVKIHNNPFWRAQIAQLDILDNSKIMIYPQVTSQVVEFGLPDDLDMKFQKLQIFYKKILPQLGWNKYDRVNLEYEGQIIAE